ncbi:mannitol-1-phosphate 5-dehydrogenase [Leifsonia sp. A12D58]|uniref:mannitol-1-phosphate 5-dehydrogenase n=1 Tax=Leifsonia sp. A12D58 TaxID=3397674 RepID=UPI0039DFA35A
MKAIHFGAGNIGRGFIGLLLHDAGYEVVFADVDSGLIDELASRGRYQVHEAGGDAEPHTVDNIRAINSDTQQQLLIDEIATADVVTTAVGANALRFVAPAIAAGLERRDASLPPLAVMACENDTNATEHLASHVRADVDIDAWPGVAAKAAFANTAVDRIVPAQTEDAGIDVTVEAFYEWVIEQTAFDGHPPIIPGATFVDDLQPYIERKLFTVDTGHATIAYFGHMAGAYKISDAIALPEVAEALRRVLAETSALLVAKHGLDPAEQQAYREKIISRFTNQALSDNVDRVGREPLRKLGRNERFIKPAAEIAESGTRPTALLEAIGALLRFDVASDEQSVEMRRLLDRLSAEGFVEEVCGLEDEHPLFPEVVLVVASNQDNPFIELE